MLWTKTYKNIKHIFAYIFKKILFIYFLERGEGKEKDRKRNINVWSPLTSPPMRNLAHNPGMCPDWESNLQTFGLQACAQSSEPHNAGLFACIFKTVVAACNMRSNLSSCYMHCRARLTESVRCTAELGNCPPCTAETHVVEHQLPTQQNLQIVICVLLS